MDIVITVLLALVNAASGIAGSVVSLKKRSEVSRIRFAALFVALASAGIGLVTFQAIRAAQSNEESRKTLLGDAERPPFVSVISLPGRTRFVTTNDSNYPAYGTRIQLYSDANKATAIRTYDYPDMAAHVAFLDEKLWTADDDVSEHRFTASIATRTGLVSEELILRRAGNNQWMAASRVRQGMRTLEEHIDSSWPRDQSGQVNWN